MGILKIELTRGFVTQVDRIDEGLVSDLNWWACGRAPHIYAASGHNYKGKKQVYLHRLITGALPHQKVDHINGNTLDNRRANLRLCSHAQNMRNRKAQKNSSRKYKGVGKNKTCATFTASAGGKYIGSFKTAEEAARAYDAKAKDLWGEFARTNF